MLQAVSGVEILWTMATKKQSELKLVYLKHKCQEQELATSGSKAEMVHTSKGLVKAPWVPDAVFCRRTLR